LLDAAIELDPEDRLAYLDTECAGDPVLRADLERLLQACERAAGSLAQPAPQSYATLFADLAGGPSLDGVRVGPYRIVGDIGHGGMGAVYLADRADGQFEQRVALKLVRGALSTDDHIARRFLEERQILALLDHPHIARLLDGGVTVDGIPWFAMDFVPGTRLDRYCDAQRLSTEKRLQLFLEVCDAVQYAHRNLVVHRDLKPSNILITETGDVKLLDFGIAKLLTGGEGAAATQTLRALTPEYASPEQIRGEPVTTASDVYSLGVILYELLSGQRPYRLAGRTPHEIERAVLEAQVERTSIAAASDGAATAAARSSTPERLRRRLRGDLDTIVVTALRKEPQRRYSSVEQLATDLRRHLGGLPVFARGDTVGYRAGKFIGRHRLSVGVALGIAALLIGTLIVTQLQSARIAQERDKAEQLSQFLMDLFGAPDPWYGRGASVTVREMLDSGAARISRELAGQPDAQADLLSVIGRSYWGLGLYAQAKHALDSALEATRRAGGNESKLARDQMYLAGAALDHEDYTVAESLARTALASQRRQVGPGSPDLTSHFLILGYVLLETGRPAEAEAVFREALGIERAQQPVAPLRLALTLHDLAHALRAQGDLATAETLYREALALRRDALGNDHPDVANLWANIARTRHALGDTAAPTLMRQALNVKRRAFGDRHPEIADDQAILAGMLADGGDFAAAESLYHAALAVQRQALPARHSLTAMTLLGLGRAILARGDVAAAGPILEEAVSMLRVVRPFDHRQIAQAESVLAAALASRPGP
jgi:serine/threonine-protein kinase